MDDDENVSLCERILLDLDNIFKRDSNILEFDIIEIVESTCNKSPVIYTDHHIALEKWCVPHLYEYANRKILNFKQNNNNRTDLNLLNQWTRIILLLNPDFTTAWNIRRELKNKSINSYSDDFKFTELVLLRKPKCASVFSYREWLLNNYLQTNNELNNNLITNELKVTLDACDRYPRNYYAWSHRTWILKVYIKNSPIDYILQKIYDDLTITENWLEKHISDYSCFQHRQCLFHYIYSLKKIEPNQNCSEIQTIKLNDLLSKELELLNSLWKFYPQQESLFLHRRFLLHAASVWHENIDYLKEQEISFQEKILKKLSADNEIHSWQNVLIRRYLFYLKRKLNWNLDS